MVCIIEQARVSADKAEPRLFLCWIFFMTYVYIMRMSISLWGGAWDYE